MISLAERKVILNDEVEILVEKGWTVISKTDTTCFLKKEDRAMGCLSMIISFATLFPFFDKHDKTRTVEVGPDGEIIRSWFKV
jgi:hypothetical protein